MKSPTMYFQDLYDEIDVIKKLDQIRNTKEDMDTIDSAFLKTYKKSDKYTFIEADKIVREINWSSKMKKKQNWSISP